MYIRICWEFFPGVTSVTNVTHPRRQTVRFNGAEDVRPMEQKLHCYIKAVYGLLTLKLVYGVSINGLEYV